MVLDGADPSAEGNPDHDRQRDAAPRPVAHLGELADDLVRRRVHESVELDLADRPVAAQRQADRGADDPGLRERRVHHAVLAEVFLQPVRHPEDAAEPADVLAHDHDLGVVLEGPAQPLVQRARESDLGHRSAPSSSNPARYAANCSRSASTIAFWSAYTWSNSPSGGGSGSARHAARSLAASSSASASTWPKNVLSASPVRAR